MESLFHLAPPMSVDVRSELDCDSENVPTGIPVAAKSSVPFGINPLPFA
jgi:hypothetical protein